MSAALRCGMILALALLGAGCGRRLDLPSEPEPSGVVGEIAYERKYLWEGLPGILDVVVTRGQVLFAVDAEGRVRSWNSDYAIPREIGSFTLPPAAFVGGDSVRSAVRVCEGRKTGSAETLWVAYTRPQPTVVQWNVSGSTPAVIDTTFVRLPGAVFGGIAADRDSLFVYVADSLASTITKYAPSATGGRRVTTLAAPGNGDSFVQQPQGLYAFGDSLLVADTGKNWLQVISARSPLTGRGQVAGTMEEPLVLRDPRDVWVDAAGFYYVADTGNARVLKLTPQGIVKEIVTERDMEAANRPNTIAASDDHVWAVDPDRGRLTIYQLNTTIEELP